MQDKKTLITVLVIVVVIALAYIIWTTGNFSPSQSMQYVPKTVAVQQKQPVITPEDFTADINSAGSVNSSADLSAIDAQFK